MIETSEDGIVANTSSSFNTPPKPHDFERQKPHDWEEAYNQLTDEKDALWRMLSEVVDLWETDAPKHELENAMSKARHVVELTEVEGK